MSIQVNHYVVHGLMLDYDEAYGVISNYLGDQHEDFVYEFEDCAFEGIKHKDGLCIISDGMNGEYFFVGRVLAKSDLHEGFDEPIEIPALDKDGDDVLKELIKTKFGLEGEMKSYAFSHYR